MKRLLVIFGITFAVVATEGQTNQSVFPAGLASSNGTSASSGFSNPGELQQIYRSPLFQPTWQSPVLITKIAFRVEEGNLASYSAVIPKVEIRLTTTARAPEQMTPSWSQNAGSDVRTVFLHDNVAMEATGTASVNPFEFSFVLDQPFYYDPSIGHLGMDFRLGGTSPYFRAPGLDAQEYASLTSSPFGYVEPATPIASSRGLITQFSWIQIPEPSPLALLCVSMVVINKLRKAGRVIERPAS
jgi:hypothetical protein